MERTNGFKVMHGGRTVYLLLMMFLFLLARSLPGYSQGVCAQDKTLGDFIQGTTGTNTAVVMDDDGAVILKPIFSEDFTAGSLPAGWTAEKWAVDGSVEYTGGQVIVDGAHIYIPFSLQEGYTLEFAATFTGGNFQNIGFSSSDAFGSPWVVVGRGNDNPIDGLYARTESTPDALLGTGLLGTRHVYQIRRYASTCEFFVDGVSYVGNPIYVTTGTNLFLQISDLAAGGNILTVDWIRITPYPSAGTFTSKVFDGYASRTWGSVNWTADVPTGTGLAISVRGGNDPDPGTWGAFAPVAASGDPAGITSRYIQYQAVLTTENTLFTPVLKEISISCDAPQGPPVVNLDPASQSVCAGSLVTFTSGVISFPPATVQWEVSADNGGTWSAIIGATGSVLSFIASEGDNGHQYHAVWTNSYGSDISLAATLLVSTSPAGTLSAAPTSLYEGEQYGLVFTSTAGTGPFDLVINGVTYDDKATGETFLVDGTARAAAESIWGDVAEVSGTILNDGAVELGVKFQSAVAGKITGIRFYKTIQITGSHTGSLWSSTGTLLATGTFAGETASGWQEMYFAAPVDIAANTTYVASYYTSTGDYAYTPQGLASAHSGGNLTALASGVTSDNGVYRYGIEGGFPTQSFNKTNYWVDVLFETGNSSVTTFNLQSITGSDGCGTVGSPIDTANVTVKRAKIWTGGGTDANWSTPQNWSTGVVPGATENAVIPSVLTRYPSVTGEVTAQSLVIRPSASMTVEAGGKLTVNGDLNTTGATFTIKSTAVNNSGSLIVGGAATGNLTYERVMPGGDLYRYVSSPVSALTLPTEATFWKWNEVIGYWGDTSAELPVTSSASGIGYTIRTNGNTVSFTGGVLKELLLVNASAPFNAAREQTRPTSWGGGGWNLLGNPFPSALNGLLFISTNSESLDPRYQALYIYNGVDYSYVAQPAPGYPTGMGAFPTTDIQAGQGFFILADYDGVKLNFTSDMRTHNTTAIMTKSAKTEEVWPGLQLKAKYGDKESTALIVYNSAMTSGLDPGYDIGLLSSGADVEIYTLLAGGGNDVSFTRQALPTDGARELVVPVGVDSKAGGDVTFSAFTVPLGSNRFWLEDRKTGTFTDLTTKSYTVTLPANTYGTGRFYILASTNTPTGIGGPEAGTDGLRIWKSQERIIIQGEVSEGSLCEIYDIAGKKLVDTRLTGGEMNTVDLPSGTKGVLIVKVTDGPRTVTRKIATP